MSEVERDMLLLGLANAMLILLTVGVEHAKTPQSAADLKAAYEGFSVLIGAIDR